MVHVLVRAAGLAFAGLVALSPTAFAASSPATLTATGTKMTLTAGPVTLTTKAAVTVHISFVCDPLDEFGTPVSALSVDQSYVKVTEAVGKSLATGVGEFSGSVTCDSSTVNYFSVLVVYTTVPFNGGSGVIQTDVSAFDFNFCCQGDYFRRAGVQGAIKIGH